MEVSFFLVTIILVSSSSFVYGQISDYNKLTIDDNSSLGSWLFVKCQLCDSMLSGCYNTMVF